MTEITAVPEGRIKGADDTETLTIRQDGHTLTALGAPPARNRVDRGVREVMRRTELTADVSGSWDDLRAWAAELGLIVDPRDDPPREPGLAERYRNPVAAQIERLSGLR